MALAKKKVAKKAVKKKASASNKKKKVRYLGRSMSTGARKNKLMLLVDEDIENQDPLLNDDKQ